MIFLCRKREKNLTSKRKFANVTLQQEATATDVEMNAMEENSFLIKSEDTAQTLSSNAQHETQTPSIIPESSEENLKPTVDLPELILETHSTTTTTTATTQITPSMENDYDCNVIESPVEMVSSLKQCQVDEPANLLMDGIMPIEQTPNTSIIQHPLMNDSLALVTPTTPSVPKERKRRIIIDDDDESPTFNPLRSNKKRSGKNRRNKHNLMLKKQKKTQLLSTLSTPSSAFADKTSENAIFTSPEIVVSTIFLNLLKLK